MRRILCVWAASGRRPLGLVPGLFALLGLLAGIFATESMRAGELAQHLGPVALTADPEECTLFVACANGSLLWVELDNSEVTRRRIVPGEPTGLVLSPDAGRLFVTSAAAESIVAVFDVASGRQVAAIPVGHTATGPALSPDGARLYVCNRFDHDVSVIDVDTRKEIARIPAVREPIAAAVTPDGSRVVVANHLPLARTHRPFVDRVAAAVTIIDAQTLQATNVPLRHGSHGARDVCVSPDGRYALVTHLQGNFEMIPFRVDNGWINVNVVSVIDLEDKEVYSTIGLDEYYRGSGNPWGVQISADGETVCVSAAGAHELLLIPRSDLLGDFARRTMQPMMAVWPIYLSLGETLWQRVELTGKGPRGLAAAGSKIYAAEYFSDSVAVIELSKSDPTIETIPLGPPVELTPVRRGELLFNDASICYQSWQSCASCHPDGRMDGLNWDLMNDGTGNSKNTKSMLFAHDTPPVMASGVRETAEVAVRAGLIHILFTDDEASDDIDAYLRALQPVPSPHLVDGELSAAARRGEELFFSDEIGCDRCHPRPLFTDQRMHDVGTRTESDSRRRFDTPTLIEVWRTAPYLHDGRYLTIEELLMEGRHGLRGKELSRQQVEDLAEYVLSL